MTDGYSLRYHVPAKYTELSPTKVLVESVGPPEPVWVPDPRPVPEGLEKDFKAEPYVEPEPLHAHTHIRDWASFLELVGPEGVAALAKAVR